MDIEKIVDSWWKQWDKAHARSKLKRMQLFCSALTVTEPPPMPLADVALALLIKHHRSHESFDHVHLALLLRNDRVSHDLTVPNSMLNSYYMVAHDLLCCLERQGKVKKTAMGWFFLVGEDHGTI